MYTSPNVRFLCIIFLPKYIPEGKGNTWKILSRIKLKDSAFISFHDQMGKLCLNVGNFHFYKCQQIKHNSN
jgi:hypothetical protein